MGWDFASWGIGEMFLAFGIGFMVTCGYWLVGVGVGVGSILITRLSVFAFCIAPTEDRTHVEGD